MEQEYIIAYMIKPWFNITDEKWEGSISTYKPTTGEYYEIRIPVPHELTKDKLGTIIAEEPKL